MCFLGMKVALHNKRVIERPRTLPHINTLCFSYQYHISIEYHIRLDNMPNRIFVFICNVDYMPYYIALVGYFILPTKCGKTFI